MVASLLMAPSKRSNRRPRAPRRTGARTTLRVPDDLSETVVRYAEQHRTSTNDALIRLAYGGAKRYEYEREVETLARVRREAILQRTSIPEGVRVPTSAETTAAILAWRRGEID